MIQHWLSPDWTPNLPIEELPSERFINLGIKALVLDVDKTLLQGKSTIIDISIKEWVENAKKKNLEIRLLSNNPSKARIASVAKQLHTKFTFGAGKPRRKKLKEVIKDLNIDPNQIAIIGDRLFTDIFVGNRLGLYTVLVLPQHSNKHNRSNKIQLVEKWIANILGAKIK